MLDIETTHELASFLEAKLSLKNTTEIPRPVHGPLQWVQSEASKPSFNTKPWASSFANFLWAPWAQTQKKVPGHA